MARLPKFTLNYNDQRAQWDLENDASGKVVKSYPTKEDATQGGALEKAVGPEGGSVKIQKVNGRFQEERTYPGSADPPESKG